jgi:hypothetical protein
MTDRYFESSRTFPNNPFFEGRTHWGFDHEGPFLRMGIHDEKGRQEYKFREGGKVSVAVGTSTATVLETDWYDVTSPQSDNAHRRYFDRDRVHFIKGILLAERYGIEHAPVPVHTGRVVHDFSLQRLLGLLDDVVGLYKTQLSLPFPDDSLVPGEVQFGHTYGKPFLAVETGTEDRPLSYEFDMEGFITVRYGEGCAKGIHASRAVASDILSPIEEAFVYDVLRKMDRPIHDEMIAQISAGNFSPLVALTVDNVFDMVRTLDPARQRTQPDLSAAR